MVTPPHRLRHRSPLAHRNREAVQPVVRYGGRVVQGSALMQIWIQLLCCCWATRSRKALSLGPSGMARSAETAPWRTAARLASPLVAIRAAAVVPMGRGSRAAGVMRHRP